MDTLWNGPPLVLASGSATRRAMLAACAIPLLVDPADIDERAFEDRLDAAAQDIAAALASAKAQVVAARHPGQLVIGADQVLVCGEVRFHKNADFAALAAQLGILSGKTHQLISAASVWRDGSEVFAAGDTAQMTMRPLSPQFIAGYIQTAGAPLLSTVGGYQIEALGLQLFAAIEGQHSTILGLPLLPLLEFLRREGSLRS